MSLSDDLCGSERSRVCVKSDDLRGRRVTCLVSKVMICAVGGYTLRQEGHVFVEK